MMYMKPNAVDVFVKCVNATPPKFEVDQWIESDKIYKLKFMTANPALNESEDRSYVIEDLSGNQITPNSSVGGFKESRFEEYMTIYLNSAPMKDVKIVGKIDLPQDNQKRFKGKKLAECLTPFMKKDFDISQDAIRIMTPLSSILLRHKMVTKKGRSWRINKDGQRLVNKAQGSKRTGQKYMLYKTVFDEKTLLRCVVAFVHELQTDKGVVYFFEGGPWHDSGLNRNTCYTLHFFERYAERTGCGKDQAIEKFFINNIIDCGYNGLTEEHFIQCAYPEGTGLGVYFKDIHTTLVMTFIDVNSEKDAQYTMAQKLLDIGKSTNQHLDLSFLSEDEIRSFDTAFENCVEKYGSLKN